MQAIATVLAIAAAGWLAWSTWTVLRNQSEFFDNRQHYSKSEVDKRLYGAFIGFWITLGIAIYIPTRWLLGCVLPEHWGSYSADDGEWSSYGERISGLVAAIGSLLMIVRMSKTGLSILQLEFWTSRFRPKEVDQCLAELATLKPLFSSVMCADTVLSRVEEGIPSQDGRKALLTSIRIGRNSPRDVVLHSLVQVSRSFLGSGRLHVYRNVLNMEGNGVKSVFEIALRELVKSGFADEAGAAAQRREVEAEIKEVG
jgi:hypothetical protein